jgi:hypothetical protein
MRVGRALSVTLAIAVVGAIIGGVVGGLLFAAWRSLHWISIGLGERSMRVIAVGAAGGAGLGAALAPLTSWVFLRRVPLGKALLQTTIGTTVGAAIGLAVDSLGPSYGFIIPASLIGAIVGFLAAATRLRFAPRTPARTAGMQSSRPGSQS